MAATKSGPAGRGEIWRCGLPVCAALLTAACGGPAQPTPLAAGLAQTTLPPVLAVKTILAFGDSLTEGEVPAAGEFPPVAPKYVQAKDSYPAELRTLLAARYTAQGASVLDAFIPSLDNSQDAAACDFNPMLPVTSNIVVVNGGCLGQPAAGTDTARRLAAKMDAYHPDLVLLDLGTNDPDADGVDAVVALIALIRARGAPVMVGNLLPEVPADFSHGGADADVIAAFNTALARVAPAAGARVVDLYTDIARDLADWISPYDGFHLTTAGYAEMARVWFASIQSAYDVTAAPIRTDRR